MALRILRLDKKEEPRASEIAEDWRKWAIDHEYRRKQTIPLEQEEMHITLEVWERPLALEDAYLFYHPEIPPTEDTEVLYIINDQEKLERMIGISTHMALDLMRRVQLHQTYDDTATAISSKLNEQLGKMNGHAPRPDLN